MRMIAYADKHVNKAPRYFRCDGTQGKGVNGTETPVCGVIDMSLEEHCRLVSEMKGRTRQENDYGLL
jgi:hypothetical protein